MTLFFCGGDFMKLTWMLPALAGFVILTGCDTPTPSLLSLEAPATDRETVAVNGLTGTWEAGDQTCVVRRSKDNKDYEILYLGGATPYGFEARAFRVGSAQLLDVTPSDDNDFRLPGHAIARIWLENGGLRWGFLDSDWFKQQAAAVLAHHQTDSKMLLLAPGAAVRDVLGKFGADDKAVGKTVTWQRAQ